MYRVVLLVSAVLWACATSRVDNKYSLEDAEALFEKFIIDHNRQYVDQHEKKMRFDIFKQTLVRINELNERQGGRQVFGINKFSDYTKEETKHLKGLNLSDDDFLCITIKTDKEIPDAHAPDAFDWRDKKAVSEVKNQLYCGSCYIFSSTGNIEGQYAIKTGQLLSLSEQQIVDCCKYSRGETHGCDSGIPSGTLMNIIDAGGIEKESDYPYTGTDDVSCKFNASKVAVKLTGCTSYNLKSQHKLKQLLYQIGPLSVAVDSTDLYHYTNKVLKDCAHFFPDHAVLLVGYGTDPIDGDYWLLKNSWGADWGEGGYVRIERGEQKSSCYLLNKFMVTATVA